VVLDEADQMLERGFAESVEEVLAASYCEESTSTPQMLLFSGQLHHDGYMHMHMYCNLGYFRV